MSQYVAAGVQIPTKLRLLKKDERMGVVSVPIVLYNHYISRAAWNTLAEGGALLSFMDDGCVLWVNPVIAAQSVSGVRQDNTTVLASMVLNHRSYLWAASQDVAKTRLVGPIRHRGSHFYALTVPETVFGEIDISNWNFLMRREKET
jgi:hypothetical protein